MTDVHIHPLLVVAFAVGTLAHQLNEFPPLFEGHLTKSSDRYWQFVMYLHNSGPISGWTFFKSIAASKVECVALIPKSFK